MPKYLVREIRYASGRGWPQQAVVEQAPRLVCPLCALTGRANASTAVVLHFIRCTECGRFSAIYTPDGAMQLYPASGTVLVSRLSGIRQAEQQVKDALTNGGKLIADALVIDQSRPVITVSFDIPRLKLPLPKAGDSAGRSNGSGGKGASPQPPGGIHESIVKVLATVTKKTRVGAA